MSKKKASKKTVSSEKTGKKKERVKKSKRSFAGALSAIGRFFESVGRVVTFFGFTGIVLAVVMFLMEVLGVDIGSETPSQSGSGGEAGFSEPVKLVVGIAGALICVLLIYFMFKMINKITKWAIDRLAEILKTSTVKMEFLMAFVVWVFSVVIWIGVDRTIINVAMAVCGFGLAMTVVTYILARVFMKLSEEKNEEVRDTIKE